MWGVGRQETMTTELRDDPIQREFGWVMGLFLEVSG
jgi:hypothetical protein